MVNSRSGTRHPLIRLILLRFVLVCFVVVSAWLVLPSAAISSGFLVPFFMVVVVLTAVYVLLWRYADIDLLWIQLLGDVVLQTVLLYFTGGLQSIFTPFYVLIIVYASLLRGRFGGILALTFALLSYSLMVLLTYLGAVPMVSGLPADMPYQLVVNLLAFVSVAFLGIYLSERLYRARRELGAARVIQENIIDSIRSGLCTVDLGGDITFFNRIGAEILGYPQQQLQGQPVSAVFPPELVDQIRESDLQGTSRALRLEGWVQTGSGGSLFLGIGCSPLLAQDAQLAGYIISFQDLTEIKKREEAVQFRNKMAAIGEMAAGLAHELRNPLASLSGSIQILKTEIRLDAGQARLLDIVLRESERLNRIVGDFLTYAGPQPVTHQSVDLIVLVRETAQLFGNSPEFDGQHHQLSLDTPETDVHCRGNPDQLRQVVWNLLQNGSRAMPQGGRLGLRLQKRAERVRLSVRDEGIGMSPAQQEKLFQPFHSGFRKGAGLGMAIVYQIVQQHNGEIQVSTRPGEGTQIDILLPREFRD